MLPAAFTILKSDICDKGYKTDLFLFEILDAKKQVRNNYGKHERVLSRHRIKLNCRFKNLNFLLILSSCVLKGPR